MELLAEMTKDKIKAALKAAIQKSLSDPEKDVSRKVKRDHRIVSISKRLLAKESFDGFSENESVKKAIHKHTGGKAYATRSGIEYFKDGNAAIVKHETSKNDYPEHGGYHVYKKVNGEWQHHIKSSSGYDGALSALVSESNDTE